MKARHLILAAVVIGLYVLYTRSRKDASAVVINTGGLRE